MLIVSRMLQCTTTRMAVIVHAFSAPLHKLSFGGAYTVPHLHIQRVVMVACYKIAPNYALLTRSKTIGQHSDRSLNQAQRSLSHSMSSV